MIDGALLGAYVSGPLARVATALVVVLNFAKHTAMQELIALLGMKMGAPRLS